jgi:chemotaxis protein CheC
MNEQATSWRDVGSVSRVEIMVSAALLNAARGLEELLKRPITTGTVQARVVNFAEMFTGIGHPESEMVGVYFEMQGDLGGQAILMLSLSSALNLADLLMEETPGTSDTLGEMERSALAEAGHLMVAYFLNAMAVLTGKPLRPSPPAVMVDMLGAILSVLAATVGAVSNELMIIETVLQDIEGLIEGRFWVLPDLASQFQ